MGLYIKDGGIDRLRAIPPAKTVVFDTETTGTDGKTDEIIQISMIDGAGNVLLSTYVKPERATSWPDAQKVNGITPEMVAAAPTFSELRGTVEQIIRGADLLVGYNLSFDLAFIRAAGISTRRGTLAFDVMKEYAPVAGEWNGYHHDWKWQKLVSCAAHYGYRFPAHDALEDTRATLFCFNAMLTDTDPRGYLAIAEGTYNPYGAMTDTYPQRDTRRPDRAAAVTPAPRPNVLRAVGNGLLIPGVVVIGLALLIGDVPAIFIIGSILAGTGIVLRLLGR